MPSLLRGAAVLLLGGVCCAQATDWPAAVEKAHKSRRIMLRRAAARKVATAGDAAVAAVVAFEENHGRNTIGLALVSAYARATSSGERTLELLEGWASDRDFYWRSQALEALANRRLPRYRKLFEAGLTDAAYLTRIQAGRGLCRLSSDRDPALTLLRDEDPRVRLRVAICLLEEKDDRGLPVLIEALRQTGLFLDYPWGELGARTAFKVLRKAAGKTFGYDLGRAAKENNDAVLAFDKFARTRLGERWVDPLPARQDDTVYTGGCAIRSCRNGDLFVRWTADRRLVFGLEGRIEVSPTAKVWDRLWHETPEADKSVRGKVICDYLRLVCKNPTLDQKSAPGALPHPTADWLQTLATVVEETGRKDLSNQIKTRLSQFASRRHP